MRSDNNLLKIGSLLWCVSDFYAFSSSTTGTVLLSEFSIVMILSKVVRQSFFGVLLDVRKCLSPSKGIVYIRDYHLNSYMFNVVVNES